MQTSTPRLDGPGWALLVALAFLWSISFIFMKVAVEDLPILTLVLIRVGLAALVLHALVLMQRRRYPTASAMLGRYGLMGAFNNVLPGVLIVYATSKIGAGSASILNATVPIFALVLAHFVTADEKITPAKLVGILLGIAGVAAMSGRQALSGLTGDVLAVAAMLGATFCYAVANLIGRSFTGIDATVSATCQLTAAALLLAPAALFLDRPWVLPAPGAPAMLAAIALALASTALAYVLFFRLIARAGATNTGLVTLLIPVGGVLLAWATLGEPITLQKIAGMLLIGFGLVIIDGRAMELLIGTSRGRLKPPT